MPVPFLSDEMQAIEHIHVYDASLDLQSITILQNTLKSSL